KDNDKQESPRRVYFASARQKADRELIQGVWQPTNVVIAGKKLTKKEKQSFDDMRIEIRNGTVTFTFMGETKEGTYKMDTSRSPKHIDLFMDEVTMLGIYEFKGNDTLRICAGEPGKPRPGQFGGDGTVLLEVRRVNEVELQVAFFAARQDKGDKGDKGKKSDKDFIQGDWVVESASDAGVELPAEIRDMVKFHVKDDKIEIKLGDLAIKGTYTVDETKNPKTVD